MRLSTKFLDQGACVRSQSALGMALAMWVRGSDFDPSLERGSSTRKSHTVISGKSGAIGTVEARNMGSSEYLPSLSFLG